MKKIGILFIGIVLFLLSSCPVSARYHPGWKWRTVRTGDFTIYYPEGHELLAQRILSLCDEVNSDVSGYLGVDPRRCPIVLNPGTDVFNGFYTPFPNRISLFETPLYTVRGFGPGSDLMDLVFTHEYTHFAHITTRLGWHGKLSRISGDGIAITNIVAPGWIIEGVTTNAETEFTDGGRGRCPLFRGEIMSFTEGKGLWGLTSAGTSSPYAPPGGRFYMTGYYMIEYLNRTYGEDSFARLGQYQARHPIGGIRKALRHVTGKSPSTFYSEFLKDFNIQTNRVKEQAQAEGLPPANVLISEPLESYISHFWTDIGTIEALRSGYDKRTAIVEIDPRNGEVISETLAGRMYNLEPVRRLPDGRLVFGEIFIHPLAEGELTEADLVVFDPKTRNHTRLTENEHVFSADLSPESSTFVAACRNGMWIDLALYDRNGNHIRRLISKPGVYCEAPCWSPDGSIITAVVKVGRNSDIILVDPETGAAETLFESDIHEDNEPTFSPDGRWIVFSSNRSGIWNIHAWNLTEKKLYQMTSVLYAAGDPKLSPDGKTLSFVSTYRGVKQICILPFEPRKGKEIDVKQGSSLHEPDLTRLQPEVSFTGEGIPFREAYKPFIHVPFYAEDEKGGKVGMFFMGADPVGLNQYNAQILYGLKSERPGFDIGITNKSFWPELSARYYDSAEEGNTPGGGKDYWYRERGGEFSFGHTVINQVVPVTLTSSFRFGGRYRRFYGLDGVTIQHNRDESIGLFGEFSLDRIPDYAQRDMVSRWGRSTYFSYEAAYPRFGGELAGHNLFFQIRQYIPSFFNHQGFELRTAFQSQNGYLHYDESMSMPRGYTGDESERPYSSKNLLVSLEYHFPLLYTDRGLGLMLYHMNLLKGSVFIDYGAGWWDLFSLSSWTGRGSTSFGVTFTTRSDIMSWVPVEFGMAFGYKTREKEGFTGLIFGLDI